MDTYVKRSKVVQFLTDQSQKEVWPSYAIAYQQAAEDIGNSNLIPSEDVSPVKRGVWLKTRKHAWRRNEFGEIDDGAWDHEFHNGPSCSICYRSPCIHCDPDYDSEEDCLIHYVCSECGTHEEKEYPFCHCGARMTSEYLIKEGVVPCPR